MLRRVEFVITFVQSSWGWTCSTQTSRKIRTVWIWFQFIAWSVWIERDQPKACAFMFTVHVAFEVFVLIYVDIDYCVGWISTHHQCSSIPIVTLKSRKARYIFSEILLADATATRHCSSHGTCGADCVPIFPAHFLFVYSLGQSCHWAALEPGETNGLTGELDVFPPLTKVSRYFLANRDMLMQPSR